jgi:hypothetical protein
MSKTKVITLKNIRKHCITVCLVDLIYVTCIALSRVGAGQIILRISVMQLIRLAISVNVQTSGGGKMSKNIT